MEEWTSSNALPEYCAAIDQGTSSTRFMIFDREGSVIAKHQEENTQMFPKPGQVEHNPIEMWERTQSCIQTAMSKSNVKASQIVALGITNQRETTIVWNKLTGVPYNNAIVWNDDRTSSICEMLINKPGGKDRLRHKTGLPIAPYFSATKLKWLLDTIPGLREDAENGVAIFGTVDTWLVWQLTNGAVHMTDVTNASRTMMMNLHLLDWDLDILEELNIPVKMLPTIRPSSMFFGKVAKSTFRYLHINNTYKYTVMFLCSTIVLDDIFVIYFDIAFNTCIALFLSFYNYSSHTLFLPLTPPILPSLSPSQPPCVPSLLSLSPCQIE